MAKGVLLSRFNQVLFEVDLNGYHTMEVVDIYHKNVKFKAISYDKYLELNTGTAVLSREQIASGWVIFVEIP